MRVRRWRVDQSGILNPGLMREKIVWQRKISPAALNTFGEDKAPIGESEWEDFVSVNANIMSGTKMEIQAAQAIFAEAKYVIEHQFVNGLSASMRIVWDVDGNPDNRKYLDVFDTSDPIGNKRYINTIAKDFTG